jgi:hypothetical protein
MAFNLLCYAMQYGRILPTFQRWLLPLFYDGLQKAKARRPPSS